MPSLYPGSCKVLGQLQPSTGHQWQPLELQLSQVQGLKYPTLDLKARMVRVNHDLFQNLFYLLSSYIARLVWALVTRWPHFVRMNFNHLIVWNQRFLVFSTKVDNRNTSQTEMAIEFICIQASKHFRFSEIPCLNYLLCLILLKKTYIFKPNTSD